jgi:hypothetical protein
MTRTTADLTAAIRSTVAQSKTGDDFARGIVNLIDIYGKEAVDEVLNNPKKYLVYD